jgi:ABC-type dipeptide/oligopeptide/nickel transport system permease subunit
MSDLQTAVILPASRSGAGRRVISIWLSFGFLALVIAMAIIGPLIVPYPPSEQDLYNVGAAPGNGHVLGTDTLGRDVLSRLIIGSQSALVGPLIVATVGVVLASVIGIYAGYAGGAADTVIMRIVDFFFALPGLLIAIVVVSVLGGGYWLAIFVLCVLNVQGDIRIVRGASLAQRNLTYIEAARTVGVPRRRLMYRHILPNIGPLLVSTFAVDFGGALVALAGLAFLGLGSEVGSPEWGSMLADGRALLFVNPAASLAPAAAIVALVVAVNLIGDWVYDRHADR